MNDRRDPTRRMLARWQVRWPRLSPLGRDIGVVLVVKLGALALLWWLFFSHPAARHPIPGWPAAAVHSISSPAPEPSPHADR